MGLAALLPDPMASHSTTQLRMLQPMPHGRQLTTYAEYLEGGCDKNAYRRQRNWEVHSDG